MTYSADNNSEVEARMLFDLTDEEDCSNRLGASWSAGNYGEDDDGNPMGFCKEPLADDSDD